MKKLIFLAAIALLASVAPRAQTVKVDYDRSIDFAKFKTYSWIEGRRASDPQIHNLIVIEIERQLQSRGLKKVEARADLNIAYYASLDENINASAVEYAKSASWKKWGDHDPVYGPRMVAVPIARMSLHIVDASTNSLIWRASAKDAYTANQAKGKKRVIEAVEKMMSKLPPTSLE
ncbi:MAG: DUF4136 domain-containing protein [Acidobacteriota bacterium]